MSNVFYFSCVSVNVSHAVRNELYLSCVSINDSSLCTICVGAFQVLAFRKKNIYVI
jgi:hypothetical protein